VKSAQNETDEQRQNCINHMETMNQEYLNRFWSINYKAVKPKVNLGKDGVR
jgi:hypothetical protein